MHWWLVKVYQEITILNRRLSWKNKVIEYEADDKHAEIIVAEMGLNTDSKGLDVPFERKVVEEGYVEEDEGDLLDPIEAKRFRGLAARANYLSLDCPDIQHAAKEISRSWATPRTGSRQSHSRDWQGTSCNTPDWCGSSKNMARFSRTS